MKNIEHVDKVGAWHRLKREGCLEAFNARREQLRAGLKEKGAKRKEAAHEAWRQALDEFPPLPVKETPSDGQSGDVADHAVDALALNYPEELMPPPRPYNGCDTLWAYDHIVLKSTQEVDAPSPGACCCGDGKTHTPSIFNCFRKHSSLRRENPKRRKAGLRAIPRRSRSD